jgi:hypothetical protein
MGDGKYLLGARAKVYAWACARLNFDDKYTTAFMIRKRMDVIDIFMGICFTMSAGEIKTKNCRTSNCSFARLLTLVSRARVGPIS